MNTRNNDISIRTAIYDMLLDMELKLAANEYKNMQKNRIYDPQVVAEVTEELRNKQLPIFKAHMRSQIRPITFLPRFQKKN